MRLKKSTILVITIFFILSYLSQNGNSMTLDFDETNLVHGSILTSSQGIDVSVVNRGGGPVFTATFNSKVTGTHDRGIDKNANLGNLLIIAESNWGAYYDPAIQFGNNTANSVQDPAPAPEPATILLFGCGLAGIAGSQLRRKKQSYDF